MPIPNHQAIVEECKRLYPQDWADCHTGNANTEGFVRKLAPMLRNVDLHYGLNGKRGNPNDISDDAVNYLCEAADSAGRTPEGRPCAIIDVVIGAGGSNPQPGWGVFTTSPEADGAWVAPGAVQPPVPQPQPPSTPTYPTYEALGGDAGGVKITQQLEADYIRAGRRGLDGSCGAWQQRVSYDFLTGICKTVEESIAKHRAEWCAALGIPVQ